VVASKIDVVCIQETKMEDISRILVIQMLGQEFSTTSSCLRSVLGGGGGFLISWRNRLGDLENFRIDPHSVSVQFRGGGGFRTVAYLCLWLARD
jgi:hypothetical protein